jgi:hypothetical protein
MWDCPRQTCGTPAKVCSAAGGTGRKQTNAFLTAWKQLFLKLETLVWNFGFPMVPQPFLQTFVFPFGNKPFPSRKLCFGSRKLMFHLSPKTYVFLSAETHLFTRSERQVCARNAKFFRTADVGDSQLVREVPEAVTFSRD